MYRAGIIGCGRIASTFEEDPLREHPCTHAGSYSTHLKTKIIAAADTNKRALEKFSKRWKVKNTYTNYAEMLENEKLDIVSVCTPPETHEEIVVSAVKSGNVKSIFCEKPISTNLENAMLMVEECKKNGVFLTVNHTRRWDPKYIAMKKLLDENKLGKIVRVSGKYTAGLRVMGTHLIDILVYFCGGVDWVYGFREPTDGVNELWYSENYTPDDPPVSGVIHFSKINALGSITSTCKTKYPLFEVELLLEKGKISIKESFPASEIEVYKTENIDGREILKKYSINFDKKSPMYNAVDDLVDSLMKGRNTKSPGKDALETMKVINSLSMSSEIDRKVSVPFNKKNFKYQN